MAKDLEISVLLGFYGDLLSEKQRAVSESYYYDDLSLAEIAENCGITRQGVLDNIRHAERKLKKFEETLGFASKFSEFSQLADELEQSSKEISDKELSVKIGSIAKKINEIIS